MALNWHQTSKFNSKNFTCGYCGKSVSSEIGYKRGKREDGGSATTGYIYICHHCRKPTFFDNSGNQFPGERPGEDVSGINDKKLKKLYNEARDTFSENAFTSTVLSCRKILMHISVSKGAEEGKNFVYYVDYLYDNNHIPEGSKDWVDHIRQKGNEANHEIIIADKEEAKDLLTFITMLLKIIYEFPEKMKQKNNSNKKST